MNFSIGKAPLHVQHGQQTKIRHVIIEGPSLPDFQLHGPWQEDRETWRHAPYLLGKFPLVDKGLLFKRAGRSDVGDGVLPTCNMLYYRRAKHDIEFGIGKGKARVRLGTACEIWRHVSAEHHGNRHASAS